MRDIIIRITRAHIRDGEAGSLCDCPIALALKDTLITNNVRVDAYGIHVNHVAFAVSKKDRSFIARFDEGKPVKPYSFELQRTSRR